MEIMIEKEKTLTPSLQTIVTEGGEPVPEAHARGVQWLEVAFLGGMRIAWNWNDLLQDATKAGENLNLAMAGLVLSNDVEFTAHRGETVMRQLGFDEIKSEYYLLSTETKNKISDPARSFGHKLLKKKGKTYHVFCAVFKGTTTLEDSITDVKAVLDGFYAGGRNCADSLKEYIDSFEGAEKENTILFITGHSLGAATANVVGRLSRTFARDEACFVYTFASPNYETDGEWNDGKSYPNFHYYTNADDIVPLVPLRLPPRYFSKIGKETLFRYDAMELNQKLRFQRAYQYFRHLTFEEDTDLLGLGLKETESLGFKALKNHLCHTYMSFILSRLTDKEMDQYLTV